MRSVTFVISFILFGKLGLLCKPICIMAKKSHGKRKHAHQTIYTKEIHYQQDVSTRYNSCSEKE